MDEQVQRARERARRYWYEDGFAELLVGGFLLLVGTTGLVRRLDLSPALTDLLNGARIALVLACALAVRGVVRALKERVTYPRTGYVAYRREGVDPRLIKLALGLVLGGIVGGSPPCAPRR
jgi:hypothetical protein